MIKTIWGVMGVFLALAGNVYAAPIINWSNNKTNDSSLAANSSLVLGLYPTAVALDYITWEWTNPSESDFDHNKIYINGVWVTDTNLTSYTASGLTPNSEYAISIKTVDVSGTVSTLSADRVDYTQTTLDEIDLANRRYNPHGFTNANPTIYGNELFHTSWDGIWVFPGASGWEISPPTPNPTYCASTLTYVINAWETVWIDTAWIYINPDYPQRGNKGTYRIDLTNEDGTEAWPGSKNISWTPSHPTLTYRFVFELPLEKGGYIHKSQKYHLTITPLSGDADNTSAFDTMTGANSEELFGETTLKTGTVVSANTHRMPIYALVNKNMQQMIRQTQIYYTDPYTVIKNGAEVIMNFTVPQIVRFNKTGTYINSAADYANTACNGSVYVVIKENGTAIATSGFAVLNDDYPGAARIRDVMFPSIVTLLPGHTYQYIVKNDAPASCWGVSVVWTSANDGSSNTFLGKWLESIGKTYIGDGTNPNGLGYYGNYTFGGRETYRIPINDFRAEDLFFQLHLIIDKSDIIPPSRITTLTTGSPTKNSIMLTWTSPGDDGSTGTASQYDIRYSSSLIDTDDKFNSAAQVTAGTAPKPAGSAETYTVTDLFSNTTYYFAIKTADDGPNLSSLSNSPSGKTLEEFDPVGYWKFDEGTGTTAADSSGKGNDGILINGPVWNTGKIGNALQFDGLNDYVDAGNGASLNVTNTTITLWVYNGGKNSGTPTLFNKYGQGNNEGFWWVYIINGVDISWGYASGTKYESVSWADSLDLNVWSHLAFTYDNSAKIVELFVNGISKGIKNTNNSLPVKDNTTLYFGSYQAIDLPKYFFNGLIDEVKIYKRAFTAAEILAEYNSWSQTYGTLTGTVKNSENLAISGAVVYDGARSAVTDANGVYTISNIPTGAYLVNASAAHYQSDTQSNIVIAADETTTLSFILTPITTIDTIAPLISIINPQDGDQVMGISTIEVEASDNIAVTKVEFYLDEELVKTVANSPYRWLWETKEVTKGPHRIKAIAYDDNSNKAEQEITVIVTKLTEVTAYPNPYIKGKSGSEKIIFVNLAKEATIKIYTAAGAVVATLEHKEISAGGKEEWDVSAVTSGIYLYVVTSAEGVKKGKVSVIK